MKVPWCEAFFVMQLNLYNIIEYREVIFIKSKCDNCIICVGVS